MGSLLNDKDQCFLDHVAQEVNCLSGTTAIVFQFEEVESQVDPLYNEPVSKTDNFTTLKYRPYGRRHTPITIMNTCLISRKSSMFTIILYKQCSNRRSHNY